MPEPDWRDFAACQNSDIDFFSEKIDDKYQARALCVSECPVRQQCLEYALREKIIWGVWGGVDEYELRRSLSVDRTGKPVRRARAPRCPYCSRQTLEIILKKRARYQVKCTICDLSWWIWRPPRVKPIAESEPNEQ